MPDVTDIALAREFAASHSEPAFAELVRRHINLVYSVALRYVGNAQDAQDVTQAVFIILAQKAAKLRGYTVLTGWLYETTRFTALRFLRTNTRRQFREQEAYMQSSTDQSDTDNVWRQLAPLLEEAMTRLNEKERTLLALRFFENRTGAETAALLGIEEWAGRKRANRALEKLRKFFTQRGITLSAAAIAGAVSANSVQAAPVGLAKTISAVAIAKGAAAGGSTLALVKGTLKLMAWTKTKTAMSVGVAIILAVGITTLVVRHTNQNQPRAIIPYKMMDDGCRYTDGFDQTKLIVRMTIASKNRAVHPADIHLTIQSKLKGLIPVKLGAKGQILNFPDDEILRRENPSIISDQPKGTLGAGIWCFLPMPDSLNFRYSQLSDAVAEANRGMERANELIKTEYAGKVSPMKGKVQGVVFVFGKSRAGKAKIEIAAAASKTEYTADAGGIIQIKMEPALLVENPEVTLSEKAQCVVPDHLPWPS